MPRTGKGGLRQGTPGQAYGNRTDLNMPMSTVPNQEYGKAAAQKAAQAAVPMGASPVAQPAPSMPIPSGNVPTPGSMNFLGATERPMEPVQAGLPSGPGAGPEAIGMPRNTISNALQNLLRDPNANSGTYELAATARAFGL
jgi:hypothetical protein